ncbi:unannotated protein [freshwater metagenome]|uniref:Unannotated protein n=1 Tax=freshwater metagenome TaxID=449393 RepID=A0A6J7JR15_9ZZZZ
MHRGDLDDITIGIDPALLRLGLGIHCFFEFIERSQHGTHWRSATTELAIEQLNDVFKISEAAFSFEVGRNLFDDFVVETKDLIPTNKTASFEFIGPHPTLGLQHLNWVLLCFSGFGGFGARRKNHRIGCKPTQLHCTNTATIGRVGHCREQEAQLLHCVGLQNGTNATTNCGDVTLA